MSCLFVCLFDAVFILKYGFYLYPYKICYNSAHGTNMYICLHEGEGFDV